MTGPKQGRVTSAKRIDLETRERLIEVRNFAEMSQRRLDLLNPSSEQHLRATLWWMAERGEKEDLELLRKVSENNSYSEKTKELIKTAEHKIGDRTKNP